jgi:hypothetical protein
MAAHDEVLTIAEVAHDLRCSKAHVSNAIRGKIRGLMPLPAIEMGRRKLVRRSSLESWKAATERGNGRNAILSASPKVDAVGRA